MNRLELDFALLIAPLRAFLVQAADFVPRLILALVVILVGWLLEPAASFDLAPGLRAVLVQAADFVPRLILALVVILVGWLLAKAARFAIAKGLRAINFQVLTQRAGLDGFLRDGGIGLDTADIIALVVYWLVILGALVVGFNSLGLVYVTDVLGRVILFVPRVLVALLVLAFGAYFARFIANAITSYCRNVHL